MMTEEEREACRSGWENYYKDMIRVQTNKVLPESKNHAFDYTAVATKAEKLPTVSVELKTEKENPPTGLNKSPFEELSTKIEELEKQTEALKKQIDALSTAFDVAMVSLNAKIAWLENCQPYIVTYPRVSDWRLPRVETVKYGNVSASTPGVSFSSPTEGC